MSDIAEGETFKIDKYEFIVLKQSGDTTAVILKDLLCENEEFGKNNDYNNSNVDKICKTFGHKIGNFVGVGNIVEHRVDLTSNDGLKDCGEVYRKTSLLTADKYRKYVEIQNNKF